MDVIILILVRPELLVIMNSIRWDRMWKVLKIAGAFVAVIIGAGFASGQEILQFFTSFGSMGTLAAIISIFLFAYFGRLILRIGSKLQTKSYQETIYEISGNSLGLLLDIIIIATLFGVGVVMIAGAGSLAAQQFSIPSPVGSLVLVVAVIITLMQEVDKIVTILGMTVPFLIIVVGLVSLYSIYTMEFSFAQLEPIAKSYPSSVPHWLISTVNYVSFNIAIGVGMAFLIGGAEKDERKAASGGLIGGILIGGLILLVHLAIFARIDLVISVDMPLLLLANEISGLFGMVMTIVMLLMIFSTAVGMFYSFIKRFFDLENGRRILPIIITVMIGFGMSFIGFTKLVALFYPIIGYSGLLLMGVLIYTSMKGIG